MPAATDSTFPTAPAKASPAEHYTQLDSLRGVAAAVVVLSHFVRLWDPGSLSPTVRAALSGPLLPLVNGSASVTLFFLLSGFVLSLPYKRKRSSRYSMFVLRRLARIYLPYLAALLLALACDAAFRSPLQLSTWFSHTWSVPITPRLVFDHLLMIGNYDTAQVNTAFWSLPIEMRLSLAFPLLAVPLLFWRPIFAAGITAGFAALHLASIHLLAHRLGPVSFSNTSEMLAGTLAFAAGILLSRWLEVAQDNFGCQKQTVRVALAVASFLALEYAERLSGTRFWPLATSVAVLGGAGVLFSALTSHRVAAALNHALPSWLGRISYSLYLVHATVLFTLAHLFAGRFARISLLLPYLLLALALSWAFFLAVERPSIALRRNLGRRRAESRQVEAMAANR